MDEAALLNDAFGRIHGIVHRVVDGLDEHQLAHRIDGTANSIAWLVWHLARIQDRQVADAAGHGEVWLEDDWVDRFGLPFDRAATGYGQSAEEVAEVRVSADLLADYFDAVHGRTSGFVSGLSPADLDRVVDEAWDPPVTLGVRLISVISDDLQHAGQAAYARGLLSQ